MKKLLTLIILVSLFSSCSKDPISTVEEVDFINFDKKELTLTIGDFYKLKIFNNNIEDQPTSYVWTSEDTSIASISPSGEIKGLKTGSTTISAKKSNGKLLSQCKVKVVAPDIAKYFKETFNVTVLDFDNIELEGIESFDLAGYAILSGFQQNSKTWIKIFNNSGIELLSRRNNTDPSTIDLGYNQGSVKLDKSTLPEFLKINENITIYNRKNYSSVRLSTDLDKKYPPSRNVIGVYDKQSNIIKEIGRFQSKNETQPTFVKMLNWTENNLVVLYATPDISNFLGDNHMIKIYDYNLNLVDSLKSKYVGVNNLIKPLSKYDYLSIDPQSLQFGQNVIFFKGVARRSVKDLENFIWFNNETDLLVVANKELNKSNDDKIERDGYSLDDKFYYHNYKKTTFKGEITKYSIKIDLETGKII